MEHKELAPRELYHQCDPEQFSFETTEQIEGVEKPLGQPRAMEALDFGIGIETEGYNIFAMGIAGTGRHYLVRYFLEERAQKRDVPPDVCYVNNFEEDHQPWLLRLPSGRGRELASDMSNLIQEVRNAVKAAFENEEYQNRRQGITHEVQESQQKSLEEVQSKAKEKNLTILRTPAGFAVAPVRDGDVLPPEEFQNLPEEERQQIEKDVQEIQQEMQRFMQKAPKMEREVREKLEDLNREVAQYAIDPLIDELRQKFHNEEVNNYLDAVQQDMVDNVEKLGPQEGGQQEGLRQLLGGGSGGPSQAQLQEAWLRRYQVNVLTHHADDKGAPVVYEDNPTYMNLIGRVEHLAQMGALVTDFTMIRPGALHRANGGYLVLDALKVLQNPFAWESLKRAIKSQQIKMESLSQMYSLISTVSLQPEPMPLDVKVVLIGDPYVYHVVRNYDPEFASLFKVTADFALSLDRTPQTQEDFGRLIGTVAHKEKLLPFDRKGVARVIEESARLIGDGEKLSIHMQRITDLLRESDYWARHNGNGVVSAPDVQRAIDAWVFRSDRIREQIQKEIKRGTILLDTEGSQIGQVNGLSVMMLSDFAFGRPSLITARLRLGKGEVVDIEREVEMGGPIHSKGVLILSGFLGSRYAYDRPLSLSASLVFEQSYGPIEGDSASLAELLALLSAIAEIPVKQTIAITGSINQHGKVQPIGGVNEKIEGFFDTCNARGLNGEQGVIIPISNVKHLMLRPDVVEAVQQGKFHVWPVETVDQGLEILTDMAAGQRDKEGNYPADSVNGRILAKLAELAEKRAQFGKQVERGHNE
jgi:lon-related putative ATP-dependent protease